MVIYRVFEGDNYTHFGGHGEALNAADKIADDENCGPNGFVIIDKLTLVGLTKWRLMIMALNGLSIVESAERVYERFAQ